jgi:hypothetical protein
MAARYFSCAQTAKLIRQSLAESFQAVEFYVRN